MALFDVTLLQEEIGQLTQINSDNQFEIEGKEIIISHLDKLERAYLQYKDAKPIFQDVLKHYYDSAEDVFSAEIEPFLTDQQKNYIRGIFS